MSRELIDNWSDYQAAVDRLLDNTRNSLVIYDEDLAALKLESSTRQERLGQLLGHLADAPTRIALRRGNLLRTQQPRLLRLLTTWQHRAQARLLPPELLHLRDGMLIADKQHALIRLERDLPRSVLLLDEADSVQAYVKRFEEIWSTCSENLLSTPLGL